MLNVSNLNIATLIGESTDYKVVQWQGWIYVFPAATDFTAFNEPRDLSKIAELDRFASLIVSPAGRVTKNRFGKVY